MNNKWPNTKADRLRSMRALSHKELAYQYQSRVDRLKKLESLNAPRVIIENEKRMIAEAKEAMETE